VSVVGLRSYEYDRASHLAQKLRELVDQVEDERGGDGVARQRRQRLALQLESVAELLEPLGAGAEIHSEDALRLPVPMLRRLRAAEVEGRPMRVALLETVAALGGREDLSAGDVAVLDAVLAAASSEAGEAFNRVVRR
jgi:hypothetical protein